MCYLSKQTWEHKKYCMLLQWMNGMHLRKKNLISSSVFAIILLFIWWNYNGFFTYPPLAWEGNVSRNARDYVNETLRPHLIGKNFCADRKLLLVVITSRPDGFEARQAIRETWGQKHPNVSFFFLVGEVNDDFVQDNLLSENLRFHDVIQERFMDTYQNLTLKSIHMLKLFKKYCTHTHKYLMKVDDDIFLNVPIILQTLQKRKTHKNVLFGRARSTVPFRKKSSKWYMPYEMYPYDKYPFYLCGPGYLMSADVARKLYLCALQVPFLHFEDVYLTGICAERMKIKRTNSYSFSCNALSQSICHYKYLYTLHYYSPDDVRESYQILNKDMCSVYREFSAVKQMIFFLNDPVQEYQL